MNKPEHHGAAGGGQRTHPSDQSGRTDRSENPARPKTLRPSGGYRQLRSFQVTTIIYDATVAFCDRFLNKRSRTIDQMVQAARSGRQNIAEGSRASATSSQTELRLVTVARASLDELLLDYEDFLRQRHLPLWGKDAPEARQVREVGRRHQSDLPDPTDHIDVFGPYAVWLNHKEPAIVANTIICLIHQANYLLDQQIVALERQFIDEGGYSERLATARIAERSRKNRTNRSDQTDRIPNCPLCGKLMALRTARKGRHTGSQFWGCTGYPECKGTGALEASDGSDLSDSSKQGKP